MPLPFAIPVAAFIKGILTGAGVAGFGFGIFKATQSGERKLFNRGVCPKCDGHFKKIENVTENGYKCDFCDNTVWISFGADDDYVYVPSKRSKEK